MDENLRTELKAGDFESFYAGLQQEMTEAGENETVDADEARELFEMLRSVEGDEDDVKSLPSLQARETTSDGASGGGVDPSSDEFQRLYSQLEEEMTVEKSVELRDEVDKPEQSFDELFADYLGDAQNENVSVKQEGALTELQSISMERKEAGQLVADVSVAPSPFGTNSAEIIPAENDAAYGIASAESVNAEPLSRQEQVQQELREMLPGLPESRIRQLGEQFAKTPGDPSLLRLVPILRETMPDYVNLAWLKHKNRRAAVTVMAKAEDEGLVDIHMLNSMLEVETSAGSLDRAVAYHEDQFARKNKNPTPYSDRLVLQMMVKNKRISRALAFKDKVENQGRTIDLASYGSLIEHYANRNQLGSSLMMLKECTATHGSPPGERSLSKIRLICRKKGITKEVGLEQMIGKDPLEWLRHGEEFKKRESSYKGRRQVTLPGNRILQI